MPLNRPPIDECGIRIGSNPGTTMKMIVVAVKLLSHGESGTHGITHRIKWNNVGMVDDL
jgi:hypothetical protein